MTRLTFTEARDVMSGHAAGALPQGFAISWPDKVFNVPTTRWARVTIRRAGRGQRGFGDGKKKYVAFGIFSLDIFTKPGDGLTENDSLSDAAVVYLESVAGSSPIAYRNIRAVDIGADGAFTRVSILADFEYEDHH
jgi:hypothetical protein